ncbi:tau-tubulin kinase 1 [Anaeramoeba ignava]|uniref:non-specific serine/threonine protein kinase n=1 Tax=Anaeramoeba ignava TaxID=1746090 RepID=A0A9Q0L8D8_ANAIG|nr:tau-tubulin kinase 1 [Anaeramoeba ignava]
MTKLLKNRWALTNKIGEGSFGEIYSAFDNQTESTIAIKFEKKNEKRQTLKLDIAVIHQLQGSSYVPEFIYCGQTETHYFLVMELLGENLSKLRRKQPTQTFSLPTTLKLGIDMISAIEAVHSIGYVHRDIKPSNFVLKNKKQNFSIFKGTARYASVESHQAKELGRRDDLISLFYCLLEFLYGRLPWTDLKEKDEILQIKLIFNSTKLPYELPQQFTTLFEYLKGLKFDEKPNYSFIKKLLINTYVCYGFDPALKFDWERNNSDINLITSFISTAKKTPNAPIFNIENNLNSQNQQNSIFTQKFINEILDMREIYQDQKINTTTTQNEQYINYGDLNKQNSDHFKKDINEIQRNESKEKEMRLEKVKETLERVKHSNKLGNEHTKCGTKCTIF